VEQQNKLSPANLAKEVREIKLQYFGVTTVSPYLNRDVVNKLPYVWSVYMTVADNSINKQQKSYSLPYTNRFDVSNKSSSFFVLLRRNRNIAKLPIFVL
jgi:hypothetical protein